MNVVVDTNILAYYWLPGALTEEAVALLRPTSAIPRTRNRQAIASAVAVRWHAPLEQRDTLAA